MLRNITIGVFNKLSKSKKNKLTQRNNLNNCKNCKSYSKGKLKENIINKTPLNVSKKQNKYITEKFYTTKEENKNSNIYTKKISPISKDINSSIEKKHQNMKKNNITLNQSYLKDEKKSTNKSKTKYRGYSSSKEKSKYESKLISKTIKKQKKINPLKFQKNEFNINCKSFSQKKSANNTNLSYNDFNLSKNINTLNKSKKKEINKSKNKIEFKSYKEKVKFNESRINNKKTNSSKKKNNKKDSNFNGYIFNSNEMKSKLLTINNYYSFYNNYSLYIIDSENDLDYNQFQKYSTEKNYINIINNKEDNEYKIIENILKLEPRNWYGELIHISLKINEKGEISKNFNEILEKYILIYNHFNWIIYSLSSYFNNILEKGKNNNFHNIHGLSNNIEYWKNGFKWKNLYIKVISFEKAKILINEIKALNYFFFDYLQLIDTNPKIKENNYSKKIQLLYNIIFPLIGYSKISNYVLYASALIKTENKNNKSNNNKLEVIMNNDNITIEELIEQSNKLINYYYSSYDYSSINISTLYKTSTSRKDNNNQINNSMLINKQNKIFSQLNINKNNYSGLENSLCENFYVKDLMKSKLFREINNYNVIKLKAGKFIIFNLSRCIPSLFDIKFKDSQKLNFYSEYNKEKKYFTLYRNYALNKSIHNNSHKYIQTAEDVLDKIYNMKNTYTTPLNSKEIILNNIYFKIIYEKCENIKKYYKTKSFVDHLFDMESSEFIIDNPEKNLCQINNNDISNLNKIDNEEKNYIKGKYVILFDLIEPIKLDYSLIKNHKQKNENEQVNNLYFLKSNYFSHFYSWCEMLNENNFNIKSYLDLKYFMKKYSINTNLLFFSLIYIKNRDISDIIKIHLLIKLIYQIYVRKNTNLNNSILSDISLYIKNILYPHELSFGNETKNFHVFYSELVFYTKVFFLKLKLIDEYMGLGLFNLETQKSKNNQGNISNKIKEIFPGFNSAKEFLKDIILIARKKPFCFLSELEIKLNIIIKPLIKFKASLSIESMKGYISKKNISFNNIRTYSYVKPIEISGLILAKLINTYESNDNRENNIKYNIENSSNKNSNLPKVNNNLKVIHNFSNNIDDKKGHYTSKRIGYCKNKKKINDFSQDKDSLDEMNNEYCLYKNISKVQLSFVDLSIKKMKLNSPLKNNIKKEQHILFWKNIYNKINISFPPICYKLIYNCDEKNRNLNINYLKYEYTIKYSEILKYWSESNLNVFQKVRSCSGNSEFTLLKSFIYLFIYYFFIKKNKEESRKIISDMKSIYQHQFFKISLNELAIIYLFQGLCLDKGGEEYISRCLMLFLLKYGDPRGRNNDSHPIIKYPLWMILREILELKEIIIYEYFKEMYQAMTYFESKKYKEINRRNENKVFDYLNNIQNNISNLLILHIPNNNNYSSENIKTNIIKKIYNSNEDTDLNINNIIFSKNTIDKEKIDIYSFPAINNKFRQNIEDSYNEDFAINIIRYIQNMFLCRDQIFDSEYIKKLISDEIFIQESTNQKVNISSDDNSTYIEPKIKKETIISQKGTKKMENSSENSFINFLNVELLDKLSYKKNTPSGVIISFGNNIHKETSHDKYEIVSFPRIVFKLKNVIIEKIYSGWEHNIVVSKKGEIFTFGYNQSFQCGLPNSNNFSKNSIPNPTNISKIYNIYAKSISCGNEHSLILTKNNEVYGIGSNEDGVLGNNDITLKTYNPLLIHFGEKDEYTKKIVQISSGTVHNLALTENGKIFSWGAGMGGQLGHDEKFIIKNSNDKKNYFLSKPTIIPYFKDKKIIISKLSSGEAHSVVLTNRGEIYCWGFGSNGQLGLGFCEDSFEPGKGLSKSRRMIPEKININNIKDIQCGKTFTMFINEENKLLACGNNDQCQLGFKSEYMNNKNKCHDLIYPTMIDSFSTFEVMKISCGEGHCLAIIKDSSFTGIKSVWSWGNNKFCQIGQRSCVKIGLPSPINLLLDYNNNKSEFEDISCGGYHSLCLIKHKKNINWIFDDFDKKISKTIDDIDF